MVFLGYPFQGIQSAETDHAIGVTQLLDRFHVEFRHPPLCRVGLDVGLLSQFEIMRMLRDQLAAEIQEKSGHGGSGGEASEAVLDGGDVQRGPFRAGGAIRDDPHESEGGDAEDGHPEACQQNPGVRQEVGPERAVPAASWLCPGVADLLAWRRPAVHRDRHPAPADPGSLEHEQHGRRCGPDGRERGLLRHPRRSGFH
jgi:hypothetical protein